MIPRFKPRLGLEELRAAIFHSRDAVDCYEQEFSKTFGADYAVAYAYGRSALIYLLRSLNISDAEILCPAYTCVVVSHAIVESGNRPVFVDSQISDCNMDWALAASRVTPATKAVIATSIFGHAVDLEKQKVFKERFPNIVVIQDCAHSYASQWNGVCVQHQGEAAIYGSNVSKIMHSIYGGMITTNNKDLYESLKNDQSLMLDHKEFSRGIKKSLYLLAASIAFWKPMYGFIYRIQRLGLLDRFVKYYDGDTIEVPFDFKHAMSRPEASVGRTQLKSYDNFVEARRAYAVYYRAHLSGLPGLQFPDINVSESTFSHIVAFTDLGRDAIIERFGQLGVELGNLIEYSIPDLPVYKHAFPGQVDCPVARKFSETSVNFPVNYQFDEAIAERVVRVAREVFHA